MQLKEIENTIVQAWEQRESITSQNAAEKLKVAINLVIEQLESGKLRAASPIAPGTWKVHTWVKQAILLCFKLSENKLSSGGFTQFYDKIPLQFQHHTASDLRKAGTRIVPPACVRVGAYLGNNTVLMPSYVNIGAYVGEGSLIDTWATVGSCAQIGRNVHISGGVGIGGVLEPLQSCPTIIEDDCFIGARSEIVEGVIVEKGSVISMGVFIGQSTRIYDRENDTISYGRIPAGSVVVPGTLPASNGKYGLYCAVIVKKVDEKTRNKVGINNLLREDFS